MYIHTPLAYIHTCVVCKGIGRYVKYLLEETELVGIISMTFALFFSCSFFFSSFFLKSKLVFLSPLPPPVFNTVVVIGHWSSILSRRFRFIVGYS